jgi:hypothetical protein
MTCFRVLFSLGKAGFSHHGKMDFLPLDFIGNTDLIIVYLHHIFISYCLQPHYLQPHEIEIDYLELVSKLISN